VEYNTARLEIQVPLSEDGYVFDIGSLLAAFYKLLDKRKARGKRYELALVLMLVVLAKLAGEDTPTGIAEWARHREEVLIPLLKVARAYLPSHNTYRRILRDVVVVSELHAVIREFLTGLPGVGQSVLLALDGKTLRGSIPTGHTRGVHLLAAYLPHEGIVLFQLAVGSKENEISAAPQVLQALDLRGKIVRADALLTQRELSIQIVEAGGKYVWVVKDNQPETRKAIETLFQPEAALPGTSLPANDFRTAHTTGKEHGRIELRTLTASSLLKDYLSWPYVEQVFRLERRRLTLATGQVEHEVVYGLTALTAQEAGPERLLALMRDYWGIENGLHYRRDVTLHEDATRLLAPRLAEVMALINNLVIGLTLHEGWKNLAQARRHYAGCLSDALALVLRVPA
jgi:predicted transposase YbfD/YdcC